MESRKYIKTIQEFINQNILDFLYVATPGYDPGSNPLQGFAFTRLA